jgi:hypothetical protein
MAQALKDDRTGGEASHADVQLRSHWRNVYLTGGTMTFPVNATPPFEAFDDPQAGLPVGSPQRIYPDPPAAGYYPTPTTPTPAGQPPAFPPGSPSYPVLLDGLGFFARQSGNPERSWVGKSSPATVTATPPALRYLMPRRSALGFTSSTPTAPLIEAFALTDDLTFEKNGTAKTLPVERQGRYNWAAVVQLPRHQTRDVAKPTILVFDGRPSLLANAGDEMIPTTQPLLTVGDRTVTVVVPPRDEGSAPLIRRGGWIMDSSIKIIDIAQPMNNPVTDQMWIRHANFYRISGVTDNGPVAGGNSFTLDLETPIKPLWDGRTTFNVSGAPLSYNANLTLIAGLSEVFERAELRPDAPIN